MFIFHVTSSILFSTDSLQTYLSEVWSQIFCTYYRVLVFKCYVIFQKSLNLIRLQPKTNQLCRPVPEMNPEKLSRIYEEMKAKPKNAGFSL